MIIVLTSLVAFVMLAGGLAHLLATQQFAPMVPTFLPATAVILVTGVIQLLIGLAVVWPRTRNHAALAFAIICTFYMPIHLWDYVRPDPQFPPPVLATVRVAIQILFITVGFRLWQRTAPAPTC